MMTESMRRRSMRGSCSKSEKAAAGSYPSGTKAPKAHSASAPFPVEQRCNRRVRVCAVAQCVCCAAQRCTSAACVGLRQISLSDVINSARMTKPIDWVEFGVLTGLLRARWSKLQAAAHADSKSSYSHSLLAATPASSDRPTPKAADLRALGKATGSEISMAEVHAALQTILTEQQVWYSTGTVAVELDSTGGAAL